MRSSSRVGAVLALVLASACASKPPPPPVIEDQEAKLDPSRGGPATQASAAPSADPNMGFGNLGAMLNAAGGGLPGGMPGGMPGMPGMPSGKDPDLPSPGGGSSGAATSASEPTVTLLEAGAEPKKELRHAFVRGASEKLSMKSKTRVSGAPVPLPTISLDAPMEAKIVEVNKAGEARYKFSAGPFNTSTGGGGGGMGPLGGLFGGGAGAPKRIAGWGWITPRGVVKEFHVEEGGENGDAPVESGDPFPEQAVGVGARWKVETQLQEKDGPVQQTTVYELVKLDKQKKLVVTRMTREQVPVGGGSAGAAKSSGELTFHLGDVYPTGKLAMVRAMKLDLPGLEGGLKMASEVSIQKR